MIKKKNFLLFSLIAALVGSPAYSVTVTKTYVDKQDKSLQNNILLLRDMLNAKDSSGKWVALDTDAKLAIPAINELHAAQVSLQAAIDAKQDAGDYLVAEDLKDLQDAIAELESGNVSSETIENIQSAIDNLGQTYATKTELTDVETALLEQINAIDIPSLADYVKKTELATVATTGSYNDLTDVPTDLVTSAQLNELSAALEAEIAKKQEAGDYAAADALQSVVTELGTLKADVYTKAEIDTKIADIVSGGKIDLSGYATTSALDALSQLVSGNTEDINAFSEAIQGINNELDGLSTVAKTGSYDDLVDAPDMSQYVTNETLAEKNYVTEENVNQFVDIEDGSITADKLAEGAVTAEKINSGTASNGEMLMLVSNGDGTSRLVSVSVVE